MKESTTDISIFLEKQQERLSRRVDQLKRQNAESGSPEAYKDGRCKKPNQWVYVYPNGHEELVEINTASMIAKPIT